MQDKVCLDFPADVNYVLDVREAANRMCLDMGFSPMTASLIVTAVWEAALNAATHGSPHGTDDHVLVDITVLDDTFQIDITSQDRSFKLPDGKPVLNPSSRRGRGIPIMYAFMDKLWLTDGPDGVTLHMTKRLTGDTGGGIASAKVPAEKANAVL